MTLLTISYMLAAIPVVLYVVSRVVRRPAETLATRWKRIEPINAGGLSDAYLTRLLEHDPFVVLCMDCGLTFFRFSDGSICFPARVEIDANWEAQTGIPMIL